MKYLTAHSCQPLLLPDFQMLQQAGDSDTKPQPPKCFSKKLYSHEAVLFAKLGFKHQAILYREASTGLLTVKCFCSSLTMHQDLDLVSKLNYQERSCFFSPTQTVTYLKAIRTGGRGKWEIKAGNIME